MPQQIIDVPVISDALRRLNAPLSVVTRAGDFVYVSGLPPFSAETGELVTGDIQTQTRACLSALEACLAAAGATLDQVVNVRVYAANSGNYAAINDVYRGVFSANEPTRTFVPVSSLPGQFDIEVDAVAYLG